METSKTGYQVQSYDVPVKRYCQTLDLRDSPELIAEYRKRHSHQAVHHFERWHQLSYTFYSHYLLFCVMGICQ